MPETAKPIVFVPGNYTALGNLNLRASMDSSIDVNIVGGIRNSQKFQVYKVFPETKGIIWGQISPNEGTGEVRYVALKVNLNVKARLEQAFEQEPVPTSDLWNWAKAADAWMRLQGYKGPKPGE